MGRINEVSDLYDVRFAQLRNPAEWERTLKSGSSFWRLSFCESMLLTAQSPEATMCGTIEQWNKIGRTIKRGERSVAVFKHREDTNLRYLFDVTQTYGKPVITKWKMSERIADGLVGKYNEESGENFQSLEEFLQKALDKRTSLVYNYSKELKGAAENSPEVAMFIRKSAECICMTRCGIERSYDFSEASRLSEDLSIVEIGNAAAAVAQDVLHDIDRDIRRREYERYEANIRGRRLRYPLRRTERTVQTEVYGLRQERHDGTGEESTGLSERDRPDGTRYGEHERAVSEDLETNRSESGKSTDENNGTSAEKIAVESRIQRQRTDTHGDRHSGAGRSVGSDTDERDMVGTGGTQPQTALGDSEDYDEPDDSEIGELTTEDEGTADGEDSTAVSCFTSSPEALDSSTRLAQTLLYQDIQEGSGIEGGKERIYAYFTEEKHTSKELADFLKSEYGIGGRSGHGDILGQSHDAKGIHLAVADSSGEERLVNYSWANVASAINGAIKNNDYLHPVYEVYQIKDGAKYHGVRFESLESNKKYGTLPSRSDYERVYSGEWNKLSGISSEDKLNSLYAALNASREAGDYNGRSLSTSDVVVVRNEDEYRGTAYYVNSVGFTEYPQFYEESRIPDITDTKAPTAEPVIPKSNVNELKVGDVIHWDNGDWKITEINGDFSAKFENTDKSAIAKVRGLLGHWHENLEKDGWTLVSKHEQEQQLSLDDFSEQTETTAEESSPADETDESEKSDLQKALLAKQDISLIDGKEKANVGEYSVSNARGAEFANYKLVYSDEYNGYLLKADDVGHYHENPESGRDLIVCDLSRKSDEEIIAYLQNAHLDFEEVIEKEAEEQPAEAEANSAEVGDNAFEREIKNLLENKEDLSSADENYIGVLAELTGNKIPEKENIVTENSGDYTVPDDFSYISGAKAKYSANVAAIKTLKQIESEHRTATPDEQKILADYSGWGGISDAFDADKADWSKEYAELKELLTDKEYRAARESTLTAFYTEPYIIKNIYKALENFGFKGGEVLDPSMGTGAFFGNMPAEMRNNSHLHGVELDSLTARIAKQLYPSADIQQRGYEYTKFKDNSFDVIVGNVPFGNYKPYDPSRTRSGENDYLIHDYFFAKSMDKLKSGGVMAFVTSSGTMDKADQKLRRELYRYADFVGGVRLPDDAFKTAGTKTVTDILFFKKLDYERSDEEMFFADAAWIPSYNDWVANTRACINRYFAQNPQMVLGTWKRESSMYGYAATVKPDEGISTEERLSEAVENLRCTFSAEPTVEEMPEAEEYGDIPDNVQPYTYYIDNSKLYYAENRKAVPYEEKDTERIEGMCEILDNLTKVTELQKNNCTDEELSTAQAELNSKYDSFAKKFGYLNSRANARAFSDDVRAPRLMALENVIELDGGKQKCEKADVFTQRTVNIYSRPTHADTAIEALHISMNERQKVDIGYMAGLCGKSEDDVIEELGDRIYCNPVKNTGGKYTGWETAEEYLSGHVVNKLALAQEAAKTNPAYERNVTALLQNQPQRVGINDIGFRLGTVYIPPEMYRDFIYETFETPHWQRVRSNIGNVRGAVDAVYSPELNQWKITNSTSQGGVLAEETFGTKRLNAYALTEMLLNQKRAVVKDYEEKSEGKVVAKVNEKETIVAREKQDKIEQAFHEWILRDKDRVKFVEDKFNELYNTITPRKFNGEYIDIPNMNPNLTLRPHQKDVIARIAATGSCMMAHEVGAGKTAAMAAAGMYLKSIGACTKPMYVVPNAVVAQFGEEFQRFFPEAKILVATQKDMEKSQRRRFLSKISVGNYDAIIIPQSQFEKMPLSLERQEAMYDEKLSEITLAIEAAKEMKGDRFSVKALERSRKSIQTKIDKLKADFKKDDFITFEELGCDFLFVDEAHNYKNLAVFSKMSNVAGVNTNANSQKSFDMEMKCRYLQGLHNGGGVVFATGTPISNSITELFVWQYLLQKQMLDDMDIGYFDNWASVFGEISESIEVKPSGDGFRPRTRFSNFVNLNELCNLFGEVFDIAKTEDMNLDLPKIQGGKPEMIICDKSPEQEKQTEEGIERARKIENKEVNSKADNMLAVCTYMTKVALDARIVDPEAEEFEGGKVARCADKIIEINRQKPNTAQAVFCDTNTPKKDGFSVYQALKDRLVASGEFTEDEIAFVHDAATDKQRLSMFEKVNNAEIKVIIGSTGKLGTGVNIQRKLSALHHLDAPYRPSDIEQRNGRGIRQGNENNEVFVGYYSTKGTFDNYRWQILEKKQQIISQIMSGKPAARTCEDIDDTALTFAEMKAATTDNPLIAEKMTVDNEVNRLKLLKNSYISQQQKFEYDVSQGYPKLIQRKEYTAELTKRDIEMINATPKAAANDDEENFCMTLGGKVYRERSKAGAELAAQMTKYAMSEKCRNYEPEVIGSYNGFDIVASRQYLSQMLSLKGASQYTCEYMDSGLGGITRICNLYNKIPERYEVLQQEIEQAKNQLENAKIQLGVPFQYEEELQSKLERQSQINAELEFSSKPKEQTIFEETNESESEDEDEDYDMEM